MSRSSRTAKDLTRSAVCAALLVLFQFLSRSFGQLVTGSSVNLILACATLLFSLRVSVPAALVSPIFAYLLGIGTPILAIVPAIALGNLVYVLLLALLSVKLRFRARQLLAVVAASIGKLLFLLTAIRLLLLPLLALPEAKSAALAASFSTPQLITALIGGALSLCIVPRLKKAFPD